MLQSPSPDPATILLRNRARRHAPSDPPTRRAPAPAPTRPKTVTSSDTTDDHRHQLRTWMIRPQPPSECGHLTWPHSVGVLHEFRPHRGGDHSGSGGVRCVVTNVGPTLVQIVPVARRPRRPSGRSVRMRSRVELFEKIRRDRRSVSCRSASWRIDIRCTVGRCAKHSPTRSHRRGRCIRRVPARRSTSGSR